MASIFSALEIQYNRLENSIRGFLNNQLGTLNQNYKPTNLFGLIVTVMRGICQNMFLYLEDAVQEQNIMTATRRDSIFSLARLSGYEPFYGYAASGTVNITVAIHNTTPHNRVIIPNHTRIRHIESGNTYNIILPLDYYTVPIGQNFKTYTFSVVEGSFRKARYTAQGYFLESFSISNMTYYDINYITVKVNGVKYTKFACLYDMGPTDCGYMITQSFDGQFQVVFGNAVHGVSLVVGDNVEIEYLIHFGERGNLSVTSATKFVFESSLQSTDGAAIAGDEVFNVHMSSPITGGINAESIQNVRQMVGYNSRALVLANEDNYKLFLSRFSFIGYNNVWSDANSMTINFNILTSAAKNLSSPVDYFSMEPDDFILSPEQKQLIMTTINNSRQSFAGASLNFVDPILRNFACFVYVRKHDKVNGESLKESIKACIANYFISITDSTMFIPKSTLIRKILDEVDGVSSLELTFVSQAYEDAFATGSYEEYSQKWINGMYQNIVTTRAFNSEEQIGLDSWNNIQLKSQMEFPVLLGGFNYYTNKEENNQFETIRVEPVNIYLV